jgi:hypothetical protein
MGTVDRDGGGKIMVEIWSEVWNIFLQERFVHCTTQPSARRKRVRDLGSGILGSEDARARRAQINVTTTATTTRLDGD